MVNILVTGGAGFIGSHLCDRFLAEGHDVTCLDNLISGRMENIAHLQDNPNFTFIKHDVCDPLPSSIVHRPFSTILHFASLASPNPDSPVSYMRYPVETVMTNTLGTQRLLDKATADRAQIILASTAEVYGNPEVHPQNEEYVGHVSPNGVRSSYDEGKRAMEALAFAYYRTRGTKIKVIRIFNTYGPRMRLDDGRIIPNLMRSLVEHVPFAVHGDSKTTRSFAYVSDIVDGIYKAYETDALTGQVVNLGNPGEYTLNEALHMFEQAAGTTLDTVAKPSPPEDPVRRSPDITKAKKLLNWEPKIDFATGLKKTVESYHSLTIDH